MKVSFKRMLAVMVFAGGIASSAYAQQASTAAPAATGAKNHPCMSEHENVVAQCKNGDPCSAQCKAARKEMRQCRMANNLPVHQRKSGQTGQTGQHKIKCKTTKAAPGGTPNTAAPTTNAPAEQPAQ